MRNLWKQVVALASLLAILVVIGIIFPSSAIKNSLLLAAMNTSGVGVPGGTDTEAVTPEYPSNPTPAQAVAPPVPYVGEVITADGGKGSITMPYGSNLTLVWALQAAYYSGSCTVTWDNSNTQNYTDSGQTTISDVTSTAVYGITCGSYSTQVTVTVRPQGAPPLSVDLQANNTEGSVTVPYWTPVTLTWTANYPDSMTFGNNVCRISQTPGNGSYAIMSADTGNIGTVGGIVSAQGSETWYLTPSGAYTYTILCDDQWGESASASVTVNVQPDTNPIQVNLEINGSHDEYIIPFGSDDTRTTSFPIPLTWTSNYPDLDCSISGGVYNGFLFNYFKGLTGNGQDTGNVNMLGAGNSSIEYTITCTGRGETTNDTVPSAFGAAPPAPATNSQTNTTNVTQSTLTPTPAPVTPAPVTTESEPNQNVIPPPTSPISIPTPVPISVPTTTSDLTCDPTAQAIVAAAGGCSAISPTSYANIYAVCCPITQVTLLQMLNDDLANGPLTPTETVSLLGALNTYLSQ